MQTTERSQISTNLVPGVLLLLTPFVVGIATLTTTYWNIWVLGIVVGVMATALAFPWLAGGASKNMLAGLTVMVGTILFMIPWVLSNAWFSAITLPAWFLGMILIVAAGRVLVATEPQRQAGYVTSGTLRGAEAR